jgi:hypothetical protein
MLIFNQAIHHLWGRVLAKFQEARTITYTDDGYIKTKLSVDLQVLVELKSVENRIITDSSTLTHLRVEIALDSF